MRLGGEASLFSFVRINCDAATHLGVTPNGLWEALQGFSIPFRSRHCPEFMIWHCGYVSVVCTFASHRKVPEILWDSIPCQNLLLKVPHTLNSSLYSEPP